MSTQALKDGALLTALSTVLILVSQFLPGLGFLLAMVATVPLSLLMVKHGPASGGVAALAITLLLAIAVGPMAGIMVAAQILPLGLVVGWMLWSHKSAGKTLGAGMATAAVMRIILLVVAMSLNGFVLPDDTVRMDQMMVMYEEMGMLDVMATQGVSATEVRVMLEEMNQMMTQLLPAILIITSAFGAAVHYKATTWMMKKKRIKIPRLQSIKEWQLPGSFVWGLILAWGLWLGNDYLQMEWVGMLAQNILVVYAALLFVSGLSVLIHYLAFDKLSKGMKIMTAVFMVFFFTGVAIISILAGIFDLVFDFRKLRTPSKEEKKGKE